MPTESTSIAEAPSDHSPRPWRLSDKFHSGQPSTTKSACCGIERTTWEFLVEDSTGRIIAMVQACTDQAGWKRPETREEAEANANLIAAAPRLLEALRECDGEIACYLDWARDRGRSNSELERIAKNIHTVIAIATGKEER